MQQVALIPNARKYLRAFFCSKLIELLTNIEVMDRRVLLEHFHFEVKLAQELRIILVDNYFGGKHGKRTCFSY